eukprot:711801-Amphidinium_carterae.1
MACEVARNDNADGGRVQVDVGQMQEEWSTCKWDDHLGFSAPLRIVGRSACRCCIADPTAATQSDHTCSIRLAVRPRS